MEKEGEDGKGQFTIQARIGGLFLPFPRFPPRGEEQGIFFFVSAHEVPSFLKGPPNREKKGKRRGIMTGGGGEITPGYETYGRGRG